MKPERLFGFRIGRVSAVIGWCSPTTALPHACRPVRWWIRFAAGTTIKYFRGCRPTGKPRWLKQPTGLFLRATFRIHNHLPPKQKKDIPFGMSFCFGGRWWIRTTEVIDDRFTVCSLWPLGNPSTLGRQKQGHCNLFLSMRAESLPLVLQPANRKPYGFCWSW